MQMYSDKYYPCDCCNCQPKLWSWMWGGLWTSWFRQGEHSKEHKDGEIYVVGGVWSSYLCSPGVVVYNEMQELHQRDGVTHKLKTSTMRRYLDAYRRRVHLLLRYISNGGRNYVHFYTTIGNIDYIIA